MKLWGVTPVLAAALLGGAHIASSNHAIPHNAAQPSTSPSPSPTAAATPLGPPPATPPPVLREVGTHRWQVTALLTDPAPGCRQDAAYWLETTPPSLATARAGHPRVTGKASSGIPASTGSSCQVTVTFTGVRGIPATAALVIDQSGTISTVPLTVSRDVTLAWYLGIPAIVGGGMALALLVLSLLWVRVYRYGNRVSPLTGDFWKRPVLASGAWTPGDSWATNITAVLALIGTVLATTTAESSLFPGVALDRFALVNIAAGGVIVATPIVFGILYSWFTGANRGPTADATIWLPGGGDNPAASIAVPSGATIVAPGVATVSGGGGPDSVPVQVQVQAGKPISVPPGGDISVLPGACLAIPGTSDIAVHAGGALSVGRIDGTPGELVIPEDDRVAQPEPPRRRLLGGRAAPPHAAVPAITFPARITTPGGARITVVGTADVTLPRAAEVTAPQRECTRLRTERELVVPQSSEVIVASLGTVLAAAVMTMFGIGAELGIAGTLAFGLSGASGGWRWTMLAAIGLVAVLMLIYAVTAIGALANPEPGSSTSSAPGTSFTL
jgi:hypothetical protein